MNGRFRAFAIALVAGLALAGCGGGDTPGGVAADEEESPLFKAIESGNLDKVREELTANPALLNQPQGRLGWTPLHKAAASDQVEVARFLLENGAEPNPNDIFNQTPYEAAVDAGASQEMMDTLESFGAED
jgi:ankyrin repeat protein